MSLQDIPVSVVPAEPAPVPDGPTGMADAVMREIESHLEQLVESGTANAVDLKSLPLTAADLDILRDKLGQGEVNARVDAAGLTEIRETAYPGVWWLTYYEMDGEAILDVIEVTRCPEMLQTHPEDIRTALRRFKQVDPGSS
jgi:hydrogenase-1 operon protein HyaF